MGLLACCCFDLLLVVTLLFEFCITIVDLPYVVSGLGCFVAYLLVFGGFACCDVCWLRALLLGFGDFDSCCVWLFD